MLAPTSAIAQQDESCDANPRWLLVTVVRSAGRLPGEDEKTQYSGEERLELVDRCAGDSFGISEHQGESEDIESEIWWTIVSQVTGETMAWTKIWVKESLHDICRAVRDCADATSRP